MGGKSRSDGLAKRTWTACVITMGRWMPLLPTPDNKCKRETTSQQRFIWLKLNPKKFMSRFEIYDETWIHWWTSDTYELLKQWTRPGEYAPKKRRLLYWPEKWLLPFSGIHEMRFTMTTCRSTKLFQGSTMPNYWSYNAELQKKPACLLKK